MDVLSSYVDFILNFEDSYIRKMGIEKNGNILEAYLEKRLPRKGVIGDYNYHFHGSGCCIVKNKVVCEYDIAPYTNSKIKFSKWKIFKFIETNDSLKNLSRHQVEELVLSLQKEFKISKLYIDKIDTGLYEVSPSYLSSRIDMLFGNAPPHLDI